MPPSLRGGIADGRRTGRPPPIASTASPSTSPAALCSGPDGAEVPLRPKSFALLRLLVENAGRVVDRDAIMAAVWPDVVVTDESITQCVRDVRKALGDEAQALLKTVPKRGYLLAAEVTPVASTAPAPRVERRLAAILAADVVGYSRLMEKDEAGTFARLKELRKELVEPILQRHGGRFVDLKGDGAIVEFRSVVDGGRGRGRDPAGDAASTTPSCPRTGASATGSGSTSATSSSTAGPSTATASTSRRGSRALCEPGGVWLSRSVLQPGQGQARPRLRAHRPAPGQEHQRGGRDLPRGARRGGAGASPARDATHSAGIARR